MRSNTTFEKSLCEYAGLFSLSKGQTDLFLLLQANTITYQQLSMCRIHGNTEAAGRLSLKRLEKQGYVQSNKIPNPGAAKYYFLTASGRNLVKELFPGLFLEQMQINFERRPPAGIQQILHRIRTNDFYFAYAGSSASLPMPWILEAPLPNCSLPGQGLPPRCDGLLISPEAGYYIEQDNSTQSESVILKKISHYQKSGLFSGSTGRNQLVFCLAFPRKQPPAVKPSFSLYRILLHFTRLWSLFEQEYQVSLDYQQFLQVLESSPIQKTVSPKEMQALHTLHALHPEADTLAEADRLKKAYLNDTGYSELQDQEMDRLFLKRRRSHFRRIYEEHPALLAYALTGIPIFAVPNHRLPLYQPYIMPHEYHLSEQLLKCMLFNGLNTDGWSYHHPLRIQIPGLPDCYFYQGLSHASYGYIAIEHLLIDLSAEYRVLHYIKNYRRQNPSVFLILVSADPDAAKIREQLEPMSGFRVENSMVLLQSMQILHCIRIRRRRSLQPPPKNRPSGLNVTRSMGSSILSERRPAMSGFNIPHSKRIQDILKTSCLRSPFIPAFLCALFLIQLSIYTIRFMIALYRIDFSILPHGVLSQSVMLILPVLVWTTGTCADFFNFYRFKVTAYATAACSEALLFTAMAFQLLSRLFLPSILSIRTDEIFTKDMVLFLARLAVELPLLPFFLLLMKGFLRPLRETESRNVLLAFKLSHYLPGRKTACEIRYPLSIARDIATGKYIAISEKDRFLHTLVDGTSGTGKTSSTILPAIKNDLDMRCMAEQKQMSAMWELVQKGIYTYTGNDSFFSLSHFKYTAGDLHGSDLKPSGGSDNRNSSRSFGRPSSSDMLEELRLRYPVCGITVMAPEDSLTDDVCRLCDRRHIPYHRIDATPAADGKPKSSWTGMNPFFVSPMLSGDALHQAIVKKAVIFSDVMQVITDLKGKADSYFTGLNRQMLANLAILVMNTVPPLQNRQATPADLQMLINNFDLLPPYVAKLEELDRKQQRYSFILQYIRDDLLGKGRAKMEDQSRGTRNIINEFLLMPGSREVYCAQTSIDFDRILKNGEITVCNYDLASGDSNAVAFGLFFLLSFNNAVLSRPGTEKTRTPHFFYIDELPVLIHSSLEKNFSLFRKFRVAMFCAIQTLDQFEKNEITKYLKGVILGCAHILVFGRSSLSDMEVFSSMAGVREEIEEQTSVSETALSGDSPALSYSSRETPVQKNTLEETDIRMRDFQEITFFTTQNGCPLPPLHAKVQFLSRTDWEPKIKQKLSVDSFRKYAVNVSETEHEIMPAAIPQTLSGLVSRYCQEEGFPDRAQSSENSVPTPSADPDASLCGTGSPSSQPRQAHIPDGSETLDGII